jgi:site-specific recombinase XerD
MKTNSFTVRAVLKKGNDALKNGTYPIIIKVQRNGITQTLSLSERIEEKYWKNGKAIGKGFAPLNDLIDKRIQDLKDFILESKRLNIPLSNNEISNFWNGKSEKEQDFYKFFDEFCLSHLEKKSKATRVHYTTLRKKLIDHRPNLSFTEIDYSFMKSFESYLLKTGSGVYNMTKFFKTALGEAHRQKLTKDDSWKDFKVPRPNERKISLTSEELSLVEKCDVSGNKDLELTKDVFLFSCYVGGMRFGDVTKFTKADYKKGAISIIQEKTKEPQIAYVDVRAKKILAKYIGKCKDGEPVFPKIYSQKANKKIKEIMTLCRIEKHMTFHASRNTFAGYMTEKNINSFIVSKMMGHKRLSQTFSYTTVSVETMKNVYKSIHQSNPEK